MNSNKNKKNRAKNISQLFKLISEKKIFLILIFFNLILQHYISYYVSYKIDIEVEKEKNPTKYNIIIISAYILASIFVALLIFVPMPMILKFIIFSLFSVTYGLIFVSLKHIFDPNIIHGAVVGATIIFVFMILFGIALVTSGIQLTNKVAFGLFYALVLLIIVGIVQYFMYNYLVVSKLLLIAAAILFTLYIVNTTNNILLRDYEGDFTTASFDYYIDMSNFLNALKVDDV